MTGQPLTSIVGQRRRLLAGDGVTVLFEVVPAAQLDIDDAVAREVCAERVWVC